MKKKTKLLAATLAAAVAMSVPASASEYNIAMSLTLDGETITFSDDEKSYLSVSSLTIMNGGGVYLGSAGIEVYGDATITVSDSTYLTTTAVSAASSGWLIVEGDITIEFDSAYLADLVAGTAAEYTFQIFDSNVLSNWEIGVSTLGEDYVTATGFSVTISDSWQNTNGITSVTYDESTGTVTVLVAVPEPSAFSVLAGTLALALVAVRRRRRSRGNA